MKAIFPGTLGLLGLVLCASLADSYHWISPVYQRPYMRAPDTCTGQVYYVDPWCRVIGPFYDLRPGFPPMGTFLPGPVGQAIMAGNLPPELLMSKQAADLGDMPLLKHRQGKKGKPQGPPPPQAPNPHQGGAPFQYPSVGGPNMQQYGNVQQPYGMMPMMPYAVPMGPPPPQMIPYAMPLPAPMPIPYAVPRPSGPIAYHWPAPGEIHLTQMIAMPDPNLPPMAPMAPMQPIQPLQPMGPRFPPMPIPMMDPRLAPMMDPRLPTMAPMMDPRLPTMAPMMDPRLPTMAPLPMIDPRLPMMPGMQSFAPMQPFARMAPPMHPNGHSLTPLLQPMQPLNPMMPLGPMNPLVPLNPMQKMTPMMPLIPPMARMEPLQLPRMGPSPAPAPQQPSATQYPTHPFTRSPRDFFMWSDMMDEERSRGRGFPAP